MVQATNNYACMLTKALTVEIQDIGLAPVGREDVMVKVESTGICGSDVRGFVSIPFHSDVESA